MPLQNLYKVISALYRYSLISKRLKKSIAEDARIALLYALDVIEGRFPEGEEAIAKDGHCSYYYALSVIKGPFPAGEKAIRFQGMWDAYEKQVLNKR